MDPLVEGTNLIYSTRWVQFPHSLRYSPTNKGNKMSLVKRNSGVLAPDGAKSGVSAGLVLAPGAVLALAFLLPGGFFFWALVMMVIGIVTY